MDSCTLPNRSTDMTSPSASPSCTRLVGAGRVTRSARSISSPAEARSVPAARCAATGMKMSRPWNVGDTGCSHRSPLVSWKARLAPPSAAIAQDSRPLSGPTRMPSPACDGHAPAGGADPGVHHGHVHGGRQVRDGLGQHRRAAPHVTRLHQVGDVDDPGGRGDPGGDAVAGRDEPVLQAVIRYEA